MNDINIALRPLEHARTFRYGTWDIEAANWWDLQCIGCYDGKDYYHFRDVESFLDHILRWEYRDFRWFAHFGGRYDLNFIFDWLRENQGKVKISFYCSGSMVMQMTLRKGDSTAKLCDSFRLLPASLRELGGLFGVEHQKTVFDFNDMSYCRELLEYNEQDCKCLYEVLQTFFEQTGVMSETFAAHSLKVFRKDYQKYELWKPKEHVNDFVRYAYHGGRVEVFKRQSSNLNAYDVNSMYPYVMLSRLPMQYVAESSHITDKDYYGFVFAEVDVPENYIPILPVRRDKLYFPTGKLKGVWTSEELQVAEMTGVKILRVIRAYWFRAMEVFAEYVGKLYEVKKTAGEPQRTIAKYLLNSFYGKFGQNPVKKVYVSDNNAPIGAFPIVDVSGKETGFSYYERSSNAAYLLPHISAAVTSKARMHLTRKLTERSYYCDTDSIFTTETMEISKEIGAWSFVGQGEATFIQPKLYKFKGTWKAKGLNREESIDDFVNGSVNNVVRRKSIKEALRSGTPACEDVHITKRLLEENPKRAWIGDDTRPWDIKEIKK